MALTFSTGLRNAILDSGLGTQFDSGVLEIRSGTRPTGANDAPTGTVLASISLPADAFAAAASGSIAKSGTWQDTSADASGTATWFRFRTTGDGGGVSTTDKRFDGDIATSGSDLNIDNTSINSGQTVTVTSYSVAMPAS